MIAIGSGEHRPENIGIVLVHGIGEQRRFEHLDWQGRDIIRAFKHQPGYEITVEIETGPAATFHAEQDTWAAGPHGAVRVVVRETSTQRVTHNFYFHEVWWADVNERYSLAKQLRFWAWGLAVWAYPSKATAKPLAGMADMTSPSPPGGHDLLIQAWNRLRLFGVGMFFAVGAFSLGPGLLLIQRLLNLKTPNLLKTLSNYISGVKLFNQRSRLGPSLWFPLPNEDFLDTLDEPPRVSVRRRVIRTIASVAQADYDRWYMIAHSQGTIAAFNGLMESPQAWPGYFNETAWRKLCADGLAGPALRSLAAGDSMPHRPVWAAADEIAYRARVFEKLRGVLTLGSPLEKFAAIWPARVPISRIPAFSEDTKWLNILDPLDPVSGELKAYEGHQPTACPPPTNIRYGGSWVLLLAHLRYLTWTGKGCLADRVAQWLLDDNPSVVATATGCLKPRSIEIFLRTTAAWAWWLVVFVALALAGGVTIRIGIGWLFDASPDKTTWWNWIREPLTLKAAIWAASLAIGATTLVGLLSRLFLFSTDKDSPPAPVSKQTAPDPGLGLPRLVASVD
jgi:hypothetical protein